MKYRPLGNTGIQVSEIGMGTNTISGVGSHGYVDEADGSAAVRRAYELGVTFFDTAENYSDGRSEVVLGRSWETSQTRSSVPRWGRPADRSRPSASARQQKRAFGACSATSSTCTCSTTRRRR